MGFLNLKKTKSMNKFKSLMAIPAIATAVLFTSCEKENTQSTDLTTIEESSEIPQDILDKIAALSFNTNDVVYTDYLLPDGSYEKRYIVEGDIALSPEYIETAIPVSCPSGAPPGRRSRRVRPRRW